MNSDKPALADLTFRHLDGDISPPGPESALSQWYESVRDIPISQLPIGDIARACHQRIFLTYIMPRCLDLLKANPLAGDIYDGELLLAVNSVPEKSWQPSQAEYDFLREASMAAYGSTGEPEFLIPSDVTLKRISSFAANIIIILEGFCTHTGILKRTGSGNLIRTQTAFVSLLSNLRVINALLAEVCDVLSRESKTNYRYNLLIDIAAVLGRILHVFYECNDSESIINAMHKENGLGRHISSIADDMIRLTQNEGEI